MTKYLDDTGLEHFFDNIKDLTRGPSYQQVASYLNAHPESLNDPVADYLDEHPTATIPDGSITTNKLANNSITTAKIADGAITTDDLANSSVTSAKIADGTIATVDLGDSSVTTAKIADSAVITAKLANGAVTANKLASDAIPTMSTTTAGIAKVGAGLTMYNGAVELDADTTGISNAVDAWLDAHPEATTTVQDGAITDAKLAQANGILSAIYEKGSVITPSGTASNYKIVASGSSASNSSYRIFKYYVTPGGRYWLEVASGSDVVWQFQNAWNIPTGTNSSVIGTPCVEGTNRFLIVPSSATYIMVSVPNADNETALYKTTSVLNNIGKDSQVSFVGEYDIYLEKDTTNSITYLYAGNWYLRSSFSKTVTIAELSSSIGTSTSPNGVTNCIAIPFGYSLYMSLLDYSIGIASDYTAYDGSKSVLLAYISTSGNLIAGAMYNRYLYELIDNVQHDNGTNIPSYFDSQLSAKISEINENAASVGRNGFTMAFVTDPHIGYNSGNTPAIMKKLNEDTRLKYVFNGGDIIDVEQTKTLALDKMAEYVGKFSFLNHPMFMVIGNHDYNTETSAAVEGENVIISEFYGAAMRQMDNVTYFDDYYDYYFTDKDSNTTVVCLQTGVNNGSYHVNQNDALAEILPTLGDNVIIIGHLFARTVNGTPETNANLNTLINGNSLHPGLSTMKGKEKVKCILSGHLHTDYTTIVSGFRFIATTTDSYKPNTAYAGTTDELAFDVMTFDFSNDIVKCVRIGRGSNRTLALQ